MYLVTTYRSLVKKGPVSKYPPTLHYCFKCLKFTPKSPHPIDLVRKYFNLACQNSHSELKRFSSSFQFCWWEHSFLKIFYLYPCNLADFYKFHWTSKVYATLAMIGYYCGSQIKAKESVSPVLQVVAETVIIKGPQLISKTNIPLRYMGGGGFVLT